MPKKQRNVFQRGNTWYIRYELPPSSDGTRKQKMQSCPGLDEDQAKQRLRDIETAIYRNSYVQPSNITVSDYMQQWLDRKESDLSPTTHQKYVYNKRLYIDGKVGRHKLGKLRPAELQKWIDELCKTLSPKTVRNAHGMLHACLDSAVRMQIIHANPSDMVDLPRYRRPEMKTATNEGMAQLINAIEGTKYDIPVWLILGTGMRRSEALGLKWIDFRLEKRIVDGVEIECGSLIVQRNLVQVKGQLLVKGTKTERPRIIELPQTLVDILKEHREVQRRTHGEADNWICTDNSGLVVTPESIGKAYTKIKQAYNLTFTLHGLRHTQATELGMAYIPISLISKRLGHSNISTTQNIYTHVTPNSMDGAVEVVDNMLRRAKKKAGETE